MYTECNTKSFINFIKYMKSELNYIKSLRYTYTDNNIIIDIDNENISVSTLDNSSHYNIKYSSGYKNIKVDEKGTSAKRYLTKKFKDYKIYDSGLYHTNGIFLECEYKYLPDDIYTGLNDIINKIRNDTYNKYFYKKYCLKYVKNKLYVYNKDCSELQTILILNVINNNNCTIIIDKENTKNLSFILEFGEYISYKFSSINNKMCQYSGF